MGQRDSGRLESGQSTRGEGTHARRAVDPAETHWQGPRTTAAASLHRAAAGQGDSSQDRALEAREYTLLELWIPRRRIDKGPGQPPQLACTGRLRGRASRVRTEHRRRGNTLAEQWIPRRHIGKGPGQPPQLACTGRLRGSAIQVARSRAEQ